MLLCEYRPWYFYITAFFWGHEDPKARSIESLSHEDAKARSIETLRHEDAKARSIESLRHEDAKASSFFKQKANKWKMLPTY